MKLPTAIAVALLLPSCSDSGPRLPVPPPLEVTLEVFREPPFYPFQGVRFVMLANGRPAAGNLFFEGPGGLQYSAGLAHTGTFAPPQLSGEWIVRGGVFSGLCTPWQCADRLDFSDPVAIEIVGHDLRLSTSTGLAGAEPCTVRLQGVGPTSTLRVLDSGGVPVLDVPVEGEVASLEPAMFPRSGLVYYLQVLSGERASCQLHPVWVPRTSDQPAIDFGRDGFFFAQGEAKRMVLGSPGFMGRIGLGEPGMPDAVSVPVSVTQQEVVLTAPVTGRALDRIWELRVSLQRTFAVPPTTFSALVVVPGQR